MQYRPRRSQARLVSLVIAGIAAVAFDAIGPGRRVDGWLWDRVSRLVAAPVADEGTIVFGLDDASIAALQPIVGAWPYRRDVWAHVVDYLRRAGARHVAIDVLLADPREGDDQLQEALARWPAVSLAAVPLADPIGSDRIGTLAAPAALRVPSGTPARVARDVFAPRPEFQAAAIMGVASVTPDEDGVVRRIPVLTRIGDTYLSALSLTPLVAPDVTVHARRRLTGVDLTFGALSLPVDASGQVELRYPDGPVRATSLPLSDLVRAAVKPGGSAALEAQLRGRHVFIGATALLLEERIETPIGRLPGVEFLRLATVLVRDGAVVGSRAWLPDAAMLTAALVALLLWRAVLPDRTALTAVALLGAWLTALAAALLVLVTLHQRTWLHGPLVATLAATALIDLAELARLRRERARLEAERWSAERASELKTQFLNHVAHELRTPVSAILGFGRLIVDRPEGDSTREYARVITRNGAHLLQLVNNLLDDATLAVGRARVDPRPVAVRQLVRDVVATVEGLPRHEGVVLSTDVPAQVPDHLRLDALRVRQVLLNLIGNAMKFTDAGTIHLQAAWSAGLLTVTVCDTGMGMSTEVLSRLFDEFELGDPRAVRAGGTGLGLSVSRRLARLMGGDLHAASHEGEGSTFTLTLPARVAAAPEATLPIRDDAIDDADVSGPLILICDDIEDIRQLFAVVLASAGARIATASSGREAVTRAAALRPDAVLLDLDLPDQDGLATASQLREAGYTGAIIAISGSGEDRESALRSHGFTDSARKPVSSGLLIDLVARHVRHWRPRAAPSATDRRTSSSSISNTGPSDGISGGDPLVP